MEDFQEILPVTKVKRNLLDIIKRMEEEETTILRAHGRGQY